MATYKWMLEQWAGRVPSRLAESLENFESSDNRAPTLKEAVDEARYIIGLHNESGTVSAEELAGDHGPVCQARAQQCIRDCQAFIRYGNQLLSAERKSSPAYKLAEKTWLEMLQQVQAGSPEVMRKINGKTLMFKRGQSRRLQVFLDGARIGRNKAWNKIIPKLGV